LPPFISPPFFPSPGDRFFFSGDKYTSEAVPVLRPPFLFFVVRTARLFSSSAPPGTVVLVLDLFALVSPSHSFFYSFYRRSSVFFSFWRDPPFLFFPVVCIGFMVGNFFFLLISLPLFSSFSPVCYGVINPSLSQIFRPPSADHPLPVFFFFFFPWFLMSFGQLSFFEGSSTRVILVFLI